MIRRGGIIICTGVTLSLGCGPSIDDYCKGDRVRDAQGNCVKPGDDDSSGNDDWPSDDDIWDDDSGNDDMGDDDIETTTCEELRSRFRGVFYYAAGDLESTRRAVYRYDPTTCSEERVTTLALRPIDLAVSPDQTMLAFHSINPGEEATGQTTLTITDMEGRPLAELYEGEMWSRVHWYSPDSVVVDIYCFPCGFGGDPRVTNKIHELEIDGDIRMLRRSISANDYVHGAKVGELHGTERYLSDTGSTVSKEDFIFDGSFSNYLGRVLNDYGLHRTTIFSLLDPDKLYFAGLDPGEESPDYDIFTLNTDTEADERFFNGPPEVWLSLKGVALDRDGKEWVFINLEQIHWDSDVTYYEQGTHMCAADGSGVIYLPDFPPQEESGQLFNINPSSEKIER